MPIGFKVFIFLAWLFLLALVSPASAEARTIEISEVDIHAIIDSEGSMQVIEKDTFHFNGSYNGILVDLNTAGSDGIEQFRAYEVTEVGNVPLDFEQSSEGDALQYKIFSKSLDTKKIFQISYTVKNVVQVYADIAELYWKFFDERNANPISLVKIEVVLPEGITKEEVKAFGHGPLDATIAVQDDGSVLFQADSLPANQMLETRILFPANDVIGSKNISNEPMLDKILEQERNWGADDTSEESSNDYTIPGAFLLLFANLTVGFVIYIRYRKAPKSDWEGKYHRELPSDAPPAIISFLLDYRIESRDLMATLLDFVRRKYIVLEKLGSPRVGKGKHDYSFEWKNKNTEGLLPHELMLLDWFFDKIGDGNTVAFSEIRFEASLRQDFPRKWSEWQDKVREAAIKRDSIRSNSGIYRWVILTFLVQFIWFGFFAPVDWGWLIIWTIPLPFFKPKRYQRTRNGQTEYEKWKAFGRFLHAYTQIESCDTMAVHLWDHYFVYAIPLGVAKKMIKDSKVTILKESDRDYGVDTALYSSPAIYEFDQMTRLFKETVSDSEKYASSDSSDSGSFSSGGGGGGGGGGRGAF